MIIFFYFQLFSISPPSSLSFKDQVLKQAHNQDNLLETLINEVRQSHSQTICFNNHDYSYHPLSILFCTTRNSVVHIDDAIIIHDRGFSSQCIKNHVPYSHKLLSIQHPFLALPLIAQQGSNPTNYYLLYPFIQGLGLKSYELETRTETQQKKVFLSLLLALEELSFHSFYHNDVHVDNIIITDNGLSTLIDFECSDYPPRKSDSSPRSDLFSFMELLTLFFHPRHPDSPKWFLAFYQQFFSNFQQINTQTNDIVASHLLSKKMCLWKGWETELNELASLLPPSQVHRLFSSRNSTLSFQTYLCSQATLHNSLLETITKKVQFSWFFKFKWIWYKNGLYRYEFLSNSNTHNFVFRIKDTVFKKDYGYLFSQYMGPHNVQYQEQLLCISHPFLILPLFIQKGEQNRTFLAFPFIPHLTSLNLIQSKKLSITRQKIVFLSLLLALEELSFHGFFHNDLHAGNILVTPKFFSCLIDFELTDTHVRYRDFKLFSDWFRLKRILLSYSSFYPWLNHFNDTFTNFFQCKKNHKITHFNSHLQQMCLWNGWKNELQKISPLLPQTQVNRLFSPLVPSTSLTYTPYHISYSA